MDSEIIQDEINGLHGENFDDLDYVPYNKEAYMGVFEGERRFLFKVFEHVLQHGEPYVEELFYKYILIKSRLRSFMIQINDNNGFANFKRFQDLKSIFLTDKYNKMLTMLPFQEAFGHNFVKGFEARIAPLEDNDHIHSLAKNIYRIEKKLSDEELKSPEWSILFHFLKRSSKQIYFEPRDSVLREQIKKQSLILKNLIHTEKNMHGDRVGLPLKRVRGIDAASSEIGCRPEIFAQAFRFLKTVGFATTFHVGEDFYDIVDGLRAIQEAIFFFGLQAGDRIGHALALGIDPVSFYATRHHSIALPVQWMLDNVTWLYFKSKEFNITLQPATENFLLTQFRKLSILIGYDKIVNKVCDIRDYYDSMSLRGDDVEPRYKNEPINRNAWYPCSMLHDPNNIEIRRDNQHAKDLHTAYLMDPYIMEKGRKIRSFSVPPGFADAVREMQRAMMREVSKRQIVIECCPSSNLRIGYFHRFDEHPIQRFMPIGGNLKADDDRARYPLAVTVNTDDLGVFATSLPNEFSLLALSMLKKKDYKGDHMFSSQEVYDWIERLVENGEKYRFKERF